MKPRQQLRGQDDLFRSRLDQIIDMKHALVQLAGLINWRFIEAKLGVVYTDGPGQPPLPTRLMAGLAILKHMHNLSDEAVVDRWTENPYYQHFCGEEHFHHKAPFDRSSLPRWRARMGAERLEALLQESLAVAVKTEAVEVKDMSKVIVDTTVQEKAVTFPTEAKLKNRARVMLVKLAKKHALKLRQGYPKIGKLTLIKHQRYAHAKQFKRARRELRRLKTFLGRVIRDIDRQVRNDPVLNAIFRPALFLAGRVVTIRSAANGAARFIRSMRRKWNASARARRTSLTSLASRSLSRRRLRPRAADSLCLRHRHCPARPTTDIRCRPSSRTSKTSSATR